MTIKDIASLAGVSISTVSKIVNGKDRGIKAETRERVLKIVKEYRYTPYDFVKKNKDVKAFLLALILSDSAKRYSFYKGFLSEAEKQGYQVQVCVSSSAENELKNIEAVCKNHPDAILWEPFEEADNEMLNILCKSAVPFAVLNSEHSDFGIFYDYKGAGYAAAKTLIESGHTKLYCLFNSSERYERELFCGVELCLFEHHHTYVACKDLHDALYVQGCTALICCSWEHTLSVYEYAHIQKFRIPDDVSVICIDDRENIKKFPSVSAVPLSLTAFGAYACNYLVHLTEHKKTDKPLYCEKFICKNVGSVEVPLPLRLKRIIVIGSMNMDILLSVKEHPQTGESISADNVSMIPGGKGINQAVGAAKLGAKVSIIGNVGRDFDGTVILNVLHEYGVDTACVHIDAEKSTGKAYIHVQEDGESGIVLYGGANLGVSAATVQADKDVFFDAAFCLLQTEIPMPAIIEAVGIAKSLNVKIMLKPSAVKSIDEELLVHLDYFIPNKKELQQLCPYGNSIEEKAAWFLRKGVKTVIVTLGSEGCYVAGADFSYRVPAAPFVPVDTTGAADAFIAALAACLLEKKSLSDALLYASYAAGFSTTRTGVVPSLIDSATLRHYMRTLTL